MSKNPCLICENISEISASSPNSDRTINCPHCGVFLLTHEAMQALQTAKPLNQTMISNIRGWIHENQSPSFPPKIGKSSLNKLKNKKHLDIYEKAYKLLKYLNQETPSPGKCIHEKEVLSEKNTSLCYAHDTQEIKYLLNYLKEEKYICQIKEGANSKIQITPKGFSYLEKHNKNIDSNIGFCAMYFKEELNLLWEKAIEPAIINAGYEPKRIDKHPHNAGIVDEIIALIRRSKFVIADLTGHRNGVYFEAGFAKGLGIEVIFTCEKKDFKKLHFDLQHFNFILWEKDKFDDFSKALTFRIEQTLGQGNMFI